MPKDAQGSKRNHVCTVCHSVLLYSVHAQLTLMLKASSVDTRAITMIAGSLSYRTMLVLQVAADSGSN
jgi:hypothetical protein